MNDAKSAAYTEGYFAAYAGKYKPNASPSKNAYNEGWQDGSNAKMLTKMASPDLTNPYN